MIRAVVFDLDDTLFPESQFVASGFRAVGRWLERRYGIMDFSVIAEKLFSEGQRRTIFNQTLNHLGVEHNQECIDELIEVYRTHEPELSLLEDADWAIDHFGKTRLLGIITDGYLATQKNKIKALGITGRFDAIVYSDEFGREHWKPSELPYRRIMEIFACPGSGCAYIADNPVKDFVTARKLGWKTFRIRREGGEHSHLHLDKEHEADKVVVTLHELRKLIP